METDKTSSVHRRLSEFNHFAVTAAKKAANGYSNERAFSNRKPHIQSVSLNESLMAIIGFTHVYMRGSAGGQMA